MTIIQCSVVGCDKKVRAKGFCGKHYQRQQKHGSPHIALRERSANGEPLSFLRQAIAKAQSGFSGCIEWPYAKTKKGYGRIRFQGENWKTHRLALAISTNCWETKLIAIHEPVTCHNPSCINPNHIRWGTFSDNILDMHLDGTFHNAKLSYEQARAIRQDTRFNRVIAAEYGVSNSTIACIKRGETWKPRGYG